MDTKKIRKTTARFVARVSLNIVSWIIKFIPLRYLYGFARGLGSLGYRVAGKQRRIALESLDQAFGKEKTREEIQRIAKGCFIYIAKAGAELLAYMDNPREINARIRIVGKEHLDKALSKGRGVILVSAHFGNFPLMLGKLALGGYAVGGIIRHMRDTQVEKLFLKKREKFKMKTIYSQPRAVCVSQTLEALRANEIVFIPLDQNFGTAGVFVDFFGAKAATATGPVVFAKRTGAALLPGFMVRKPDDSQELIFEPEVDLVEGKNFRETVQINIQRLTSIIETYIRRYPDEWAWIHRRWKSRPQEDEKLKYAKEV